MPAKKSIIEPSRTLPVLLETDVVVAGGGTTGPIAAIAAARQGRKVVLIERYGALGGNLTLGLNTKPSGALLGGLPLEIWNIARGIGAAGSDYVAHLKEGSVKIASPSDPEIMKVLLAKLCADSGVQILFESFVSYPLVEDQTVRGVIIEGKGGRQFVAAKVVIDCTADGDVAAKAGVPFILGTGGDQAVMQPVSIFFTMRDVDLRQLIQWTRAHPEDVPDRAIPEDEKDYDYGIWLTGFVGMLQKFQREKGITLQRENITLKTTNGLMFVNATRAVGIDGLSLIDVSAATTECYRQIQAVAQFLVEKVGGFERAKIDRVSPYLGVRETRHIQGEYVLTGDDVIQGRSFEDSIAADASALDIHDVRGADVDFKGLPTYEIPYRSLVPVDIEQILVAGRCISVDHIAHGRTRNIPACLATGQAAGIAAAVALGSGATVRRVNVGTVQDILKGLKMPLHAAEVH